MFHIPVLVSVILAGLLQHSAAGHHVFKMKSVAK